MLSFCLWSFSRYNPFCVEFKIQNSKIFLLLLFFTLISLLSPEYLTNLNETTLLLCNPYTFLLVFPFCLLGLLLQALLSASEELPVTTQTGCKAVGLLRPPGNAAWKTLHKHRPEQYSFYLMLKIQK